MTLSPIWSPKVRLDQYLNQYPFLPDADCGLWEIGEHFFITAFNFNSDSVCYGYWRGLIILTIQREKLRVLLLGLNSGHPHELSTHVMIVPRWKKKRVWEVPWRWSTSYLAPPTPCCSGGRIGEHFRLGSLMDGIGWVYLEPCGMGWDGWVEE